MTSHRPVKWAALLIALALLAAACGDDAADDNAAAEDESAEDESAEDETSEDETTEDETTEDETTLRIGMAYPGDAPYLDGYRNGFEAAAADRGVEIVLLNAGWDAATQAEQMTQLISQDLDGLIVWPVDPEAICTSIAAASEAGVPMVASNSPVSDTCSDLLVSYTGPDSEAQGCEAGKIASELLGGEGNVLIVEGLAGTAPALQRTGGFTRCIDDGIVVLDAQPGDWDKAIATTVTRDMLTRHGDAVDLIYGHDDTMAVGAAEAVAEAEFGIVLIGIGGSGSGLDAVREGILSTTIIQSPVTDGIMPVDAIVDYLEGKDVEALQILPMPIVTIDNVDDFEAEW